MEAEQAVLGSMLIDSGCIPQVVEALKVEDFYLEHNQALFATMHAMFSHAQVIDPVTVLEQMRQNGTYDDKTTRSYVVQLIDVTPTSANVREYVKIVQDKALLRRIAQAVDEVRGLVERNEGSGQGHPGGGGAADLRHPPRPCRPGADPHLPGDPGRVPAPGGAGVQGGPPAGPFYGPH